MSEIEETGPEATESTPETDTEVQTGVVEATQTESAEAVHAEVSDAPAAKPRVQRNPTAEAATATAPTPVVEAKVVKPDPRSLPNYMNRDFIPGSESQEETDAARNLRKERQGIVVSDKMDKTIVILVQRRLKHPIYGKYIKKSTKFAVHDEKNDAHVGDRVRIMETRPLSKNKRWRLVEILERAK